ncbi:MAG: hypothetical protein ACH350_09300 [Parachlamydiaceae bacterium]
MLATNKSTLETYSFTTGDAHPITGVTVATKGTVPFARQVLTKLGANITGTTSVDISGNMLDSVLLSSASWANIRDIEKGDYLYVNDKAFKIKSVAPSKKVFRLKYPLLSAISAANILIAKQLYRKIIIEAVGTANTALVNGIALKSGGILILDNSDIVEPIFYKADGANEKLKFTVGI